MKSETSRRPIVPAWLYLVVPLLAGCTDAQADNFVEAIGALLLAFIVAAVVMAVLYLLVAAISLLILTLECALIVINLSRPTSLSTSSAIALGGMHILGTLGGLSFAVGWSMEQAANGAIPGASTPEGDTSIWISAAISALMNTALGAGLIGSGVSGSRKIAAKEAR